LERLRLEYLESARRRRAKRRTPCNVARALAVVFGERPAARSSPIRSATSSTSSDPIRRWPRRGEDVVVKVEAVRLVCTGVPFSGRHHRLEARAPAAGDGVEAQARRGRHPARLQGRDQTRAGAPGLADNGTGGAEVKAPGAAGADRELAVGLAVDAALDAGAARLSPSRHRDLRS
jgi:hypothetical protein